MKPKSKYSELWRDSCEEGYMISEKGNVYSKKTDTYMAIFPKAGHATVKVNGKDRRLATFMWESFKGKIPEGCSIIYRNRNKMDCDIYNLICVDKKIATRINHRISKIKKIGLFENGECIKVFRSERAASIALGINRQSLNEYLNGKIKYPEQMKKIMDLRRI